MRVTHRFAIFLLCVAACCLAPLAAAAQDDVNVQNVSLAEALERALRLSAVAELLSIEHDVAVLGAAELEGALHPQLTLNLQGVHSKGAVQFDPICFDFEINDEPVDFCFPPEDELNANLQELSGSLVLQSALLPTAEVRAMRTLAQSERDLAAARLASAQAELSLEVLRLYYGLLRADLAVEMAEVAREMAAMALAEATDREAQGTASRADRLAAEADLHDAEASRVRAVAARDRARSALNQLTGFPLERATRPLRPPVPLGEPPALRQHTTLSRPDVRESEAAVARAEAQYALSRSEALPTIRLFGSFTRDNLEATLGIDRTGFAQISVGTARRWFNDERLESQGGTTWSIGFDVSWPLHDAGTSAARAQQAAKGLQAAQVQLQQHLDGVESELLGTRAEWTAGLRMIEAAQNALEGRLALKEAIHELYVRGAASQRELVQAELGVLEAEMRLLEAEEAYMLARAAHLHAAGMWLDEVNAWIGGGFGSVRLR